MGDSDIGGNLHDSNAEAAKGILCSRQALWMFI